MKRDIFKISYVKFHEFNLAVSTLEPVTAHARLILLHGGGLQASMDRFDQLRLFLYDHDISTVSFDFIGHGLTGGNIEETSLSTRTEQALRVIQSLKWENFSILGTSMGAYTALKTASLLDPNSIILFVPAVYSTNAYSVKFGHEFSSEIRKEMSWNGSDAWDICSFYKGKILIFEAKNDSVIPDEIPKKIIASAVSSKDKKLVSVNCDHSIFSFLNANRALLKKIANEISHYVN